MPPENQQTGSFEPPMAPVPPQEPLQAPLPPEQSVPQPQIAQTAADPYLTVPLAAPVPPAPAPQVFAPTAPTPAHDLNQIDVPQMPAMSAPGQPLPPPQPAPAAHPVQPDLPPQPVQPTTPVRPAGESNTLAIVGLVLAFVLSPVGLVISIIAFSKHKNGGTAKMLSIIGIIVSAISVLIIGFLLIVTLASVGSIQKQAHDTKYKTDLRTMQTYLEGSYATTGSYPTLAELNDAGWRATNMKGITPEQLSPNSSVLQLVSGKPTDNEYAYNPSPSDCRDTQANPCKSFTLLAKVSSGSDYTITSLNN